MRAHRLTTLLVLAYVGFARAGATQASAQTAADKDAGPELVFEREVFVYPATHRRDPFVPLIGAGSAARFEELALQGIIYSPQADQSVALLVDRTGRIYRVRRGDMVANARVTNIAPRSVLFAVESFGVVRQERLELKRNDPEGVRG